MDKRRLLTLMGGSRKPVVIISDEFTDAAGTALNLHTIAPTNSPATVWTMRAGAWTIIASGKATSSTVDNSISTIDAGIADGIIEAKAVSAAVSGTFDRSTGIVIRYTDASNCWAITIVATGGFDLWEVNAGIVTRRATTFLGSIVSGQEYAIKVTFKGTNITATLDGANEISYASAELNKTVTVHGIKSRNQNTETIDDFKVSTNP